MCIRDSHYTVLAEIVYIWRTIHNIETCKKYLQVTYKTTNIQYIFCLLTLKKKAVKSHTYWVHWETDPKSSIHYRMNLMSQTRFRVVQETATLHCATSVHTEYKQILKFCKEGLPLFSCCLVDERMHMITEGLYLFR